MTTLEKQRQEMKAQQQIVLNESKASEMEYNEFQYFLGLDTLSANIEDQELADKLTKSKQYWSWFKVRYQEHERVVIPYLRQKGTLEWIDYKRLMLEVIDSKRTTLSILHFLTIFKHIR